MGTEDGEPSHPHTHRPLIETRPLSPQGPVAIVVVSLGAV